MQKEGQNPYKFSCQLHEIVNTKTRKKMRKLGYWSMKWEQKNRKRLSRKSNIDK